MIKIQITDNSDKFKSEIARKLPVALESIGLTAEGYAKAKTPVDTGRLRNSITHTAKDDTAYIGTNVEYAAYVEFNDSASHKTGNAHFLRDAATTHTDEYKKMVETILKE